MVSLPGSHTAWWYGRAIRLYFLLSLAISLLWIVKLFFIDSTSLTSPLSGIDQQPALAAHTHASQPQPANRKHALLNELSLQLSGPVQEYTLAFTDHIYCINEASRLGRKGRMSELLNYMHLRAEMFSKKHSSHLDAWRDMINKGYGRALVLEDDIDFELDAVSVIGRALDALNSTAVDWDILYVGHCSVEEKKGKEISTNSKIHKSTHPFCTSGYVLSRNGAKKLFAYFIEHNQQEHALDVQLVALIKRKMLKSYSLYPPVVYQRRDLYPSDDGLELKIAKKFKNSAWDEALAFVPRLANWVDPLDSVYLNPAFKHIPSWMEDRNHVN